jgi:hypothetical protein
VENLGECALLVYAISKNISEEFSLERSIPLDTEFKSEIGKKILKKTDIIMYYYVSSFIPDTANANIVSTDVYLKITRRKLSLLFEMLPGFKANKFIDELMKASEGEYSV